MAHEQNGETALWIADYKPGEVQASPWGPHSTSNAGESTETSDGLTLLPLTGSRFLSWLKPKFSSGKHIFLHPWRNLLLWDVRNWNRAQCLISFLWTEVRFLQSRFFCGAFLPTCDIWGLGWPLCLCHFLAQIWRSDQTMPFERESCRREMWPNGPNGHPGWAPEVLCADNLQKSMERLSPSPWVHYLAVGGLTWMLWKV